MDEDGGTNGSTPTALSASTAPGLFDGAVSISAVQWLCNADTARADPRRRLRRFFETLYSCLRRGARAALQVYPSNPEQASMMGAPRATRAVGSANGRNPIPIIVPCHRVIARDGSLGGYALGLDMKRALLALEGVSVAA